MTTMSRKDFLRTGLSTMAVAGLPASGVAAAVAGTAAKPAGPVRITTLNPTIRLYPVKALGRMGDVRFATAEIGTMMPFLGAGEITWTVSVPEDGLYDLAICCSTTTAPGQPVNVKAGKTSVDYAIPVTDGYFFPHPEGPDDNPGDPSGESFFRLREYYNFARVAVPGTFQLVRGVNVVRLRVIGQKGKEILRLRSVELTPVTARAAIVADQKRARARRANTDWFARAGYGIWFHFLDLTTPPHGPRKPYAQAVDELDVEKLVGTVAETGAKYLMFTVNHGNPTCPAPIKSWEKLHPGWTTKRDLIAELADALGRRGMRLMLYMNPPGVGGMALNPGTVNGIPGYNEDEYASQLVDVFREFGERYGPRVAGYWFDSTFEATECYPNLPFEALDAAIKTGHPDRLVAWNNWVFPAETEWQDYFAGELTDLPTRSFGGRYIDHGVAKGLQAHVALRFDADWLHIAQDKPMPPPRFKAQELADYIRRCQAEQVPVTLGVGIFQDGSLGPQAMPILREVGRLVRGNGAGA
ncbi:alpha-L-fucosidase [Sphingomonas sp.]|uniref:alpha-L-fucosidase n=1 Tax=Sphingomonas sp. TaxID=28214 RepID=UPI002C3352C4|nr:alpha-L-fucosidase [Sphingomonas sp.]HWK37058.1 alpha-L-fucosidase [Sphingomonas sp.]